MHELNYQRLLFIALVDFEMSNNQEHFFNNLAKVGLVV